DGRIYRNVADNRDPVSQCLNGDGAIVQEGVSGQEDVGDMNTGIRQRLENLPAVCDLRRLRGEVDSAEATIMMMDSERRCLGSPERCVRWSLTGIVGCRSIPVRCRGLRLGSRRLVKRLD